MMKDASLCFPAVEAIGQRLELKRGSVLLQAIFQDVFLVHLWSGLISSGDHDPLAGFLDCLAVAAFKGFFQRAPA